MRVKRISISLLGTAAVSAALVACSSKPTAAQQPVAEVGVVTAEPQAVPVTTELPGRTNAFLVAQVRARVDGIVLRREFVEGSEVTAGQRLYKIDPAPYIAALNSAKATLARAQANLATQKALVVRYKVLVGANAVSKQDYDNAIAAQGQAAADVAAGKAAVDTAQINLGYTDVVAPVSGRVGISQVTPGAYVQAGDATLMATVQQLDPMYVDLTQSSLDGLKLRQALQSGRLKTAGGNGAKVELVLEDGRSYGDTGQLQFSDVTVDQSTGSVTLRALFPNRDRVLLPGMFVRARIEEGVNEHAYLIPQIGVQHDQKGQPTSLVVNAQDKVEVRTLITDGTRGNDWIVESGLNPGDRVIVQGVEKVRPDEQVHTTPAQVASSAASIAQ
jgi:membrane fusion protein, multidrug efflux system